MSSTLRQELYDPTPASIQYDRGLSRFCPLVGRRQSSEVQTVCPGVQMSAQHGAQVLGVTLPACVLCSSTLASSISSSRQHCTTPVSTSPCVGLSDNVSAPSTVRCCPWSVVSQFELTCMLRHIWTNGRNITLCVKLEIGNVLQRCQERTEPRPYVHTLVKFGRVVHEIFSHTDRQTCSNAHTPLRTWSECRIKPRHSDPLHL